MGRGRIGPPALLHVSLEDALMCKDARAPSLAKAEMLRLKIMSGATTQPQLLEHFQSLEGGTRCRTTHFLT